MSKRHIISILIGFITAFIIPLSAFGGDVVLTWRANTESDLANYRVYYGTSSRSYGPGIPVQGATQYTVRDLRNNITYYFAVTAVDTSGNESGYSVEAVKTVLPPQDTSSPTITISNPTNANSYTSTDSGLALSGSAIDDTGISRVTWSNSLGGNGIANGTTNWSIPYISLSEGSNIITVTAADTAGNSASDRITVSYTAPDDSAPNISITTPTGANTYVADRNTVTLAGTATDDSSVTQVTWTNSVGSSGTASGTSSWSIANIALEEGNNVITVTAVDAAGNRGSDTITVAYTLPDQPEPDISAPRVSITSPTNNGSYISGSPSLSIGGNASDDRELESVTWRNSRGGSGSANFNVTTLSWLSSRGETGSASDTSSWSITDIGLVEGNNVITVTATDAAGNQNRDALTVIYEPLADSTPIDEVGDDTPPELLIVSPTQRRWYFTRKPSIDLFGHSQDNKGVTAISWTSSIGQEGVCDWSQDVTKGTISGSDTIRWSASNVSLERRKLHKITVTASDGAGNVSQKSLFVIRW